MDLTYCGLREGESGSEDLGLREVGLDVVDSKYFRDYIFNLLYISVCLFVSKRKNDSEINLNIFEGTHVTH